MISIIIILILMLTKVSYSIINANNNNNNNNNFYGNITNQISDINYLSQLPLEKLLKVRKSLNDMISCFPLDINNNNDKIVMINHNISDEVLSKRSQYINGDIVDATQFISSSVPLPATALPLIGKLKSFTDFTGDIRKHYGEQWDGGLQPSKPTKIQTIFQISITALAFLAFGGYLLCMIVQAIQSKGTTYYHPAMLPMVNPGNGVSGETVNKNGQTVQVTTTRKKRRPPYRGKRDTISDQQATPDPIQMYNTLIHFAEGYVQLSS